MLSASVTGGSGGLYNESYEYSGNGGKISNLTRKGTTNYTYGTQSASCPDGALSKPHAVVTAGANTFTYDCNTLAGTGGNMVKRNGTAYTLTYDAENQLTRVSGGASASFAYDGDGRRVKATFGSSTTVYIGDYYEQTGTASTKYYYAGSRRIALRRSGYASDNGLFWLLTDHLGSTAITAYSSGGKKAELRYKAYGETRYTWGTTPTTYRFTGQRLDDSTGLYYYGYGARYPGEGRQDFATTRRWGGSCRRTRWCRSRGTRKTSTGSAFA